MCLDAIGLGELVGGLWPQRPPSAAAAGLDGGWRADRRQRVHARHVHRDVPPPRPQRGHRLHRRPAGMVPGHCGRGAALSAKDAPQCRMPLIVANGTAYSREGEVWVQLDDTPNQLHCNPKTEIDFLNQKMLDICWAFAHSQVFEYLWSNYPSIYLSCPVLSPGFTGCPGMAPRLKTMLGAIAQHFTSLVRACGSCMCPRTQLWLRVYSAILRRSTMFFLEYEGFVVF